MKKFISFLLGFIMCNYAMATDFSGSYKCDLTDHTDGYFTAILILNKDKNASFDKIGYGSYLLNFHVKGIPYYYSGFAAAKGNEMALYFEAMGKYTNPEDRGVGIASIIVDQDKQGKEIVTLHKFYYEKSYKGNSNYGFEKCIKI